MSDFSEEEIYQRIIGSLEKKVIQDGIGKSEQEFKRYIGEKPSSRFWLGWLGPEPTPEEMSRLRQRFKPCSQGFSFKVEELPVKLQLTGSFVIWASLHPTLQEQREYARKSGNDSYELQKVRMKIPIPEVRIDKQIPDPGHYHCGSDRFSEAILKQLTDLPSGTTPYRPKVNSYRRPTEEDLINTKSWDEWVKVNLKEPEVPNWNAEFDIEVIDTPDNEFEITVLLTNRTSNKENQNNINQDLNLYEVEVSAKPSVEFKAYELEKIPDSFRYDRNIFVLGRNCSAEKQDGEIISSFAPTAKTKRVRPRLRYEGEEIDTRFSNLKKEPISLVSRLIEMADSWTGKNWARERLRSLAEQEDWSDEMFQQALEERSKAQDEIKWLQQGLSVLQVDNDLLRAFKLMHETMELVTENKDYDSWYPYQLAFIVGCLPGVLNEGRTLKVDILWFKTGGGKTEAYLGLNLVHMFYERLKGRRGGTQTWARFPLRLLSLQQTQRFAESVINAEIIRRRYEKKLEGDPFSIGFYVGSSLTPNKIILPGGEYYKGWNPRDKETIETCRVLEECPACNSNQKPKIRFDEEHHTLVHECMNEKCPFYGDWLPIYVIDDDIYRRAPTVIVGTVDKLAQIGLNKGFRILMGESSSYCPKHGYSYLPDKCARYWECDEDLRSVGEEFKGINFEIQDELHLINESLGALDANYETLFQKLNSMVSGGQMRIVAATATIEGYKEQANHLYRRESRRFPLPGPTKGESFWAIENESQILRNYVGILPRGTTMLDVSFRIAKCHWEFIETGLDNPDSFCVKFLSIDDSYSNIVSEALHDMYETMVTYSLRKQDLERFAKDIQEDPKLCSDNRNYSRITGDVRNINPILNKLQNPPSKPEKRIRVLGATSAIAHGVDIDRLNIMTVMGMPSKTGEFIQATARVGRVIPAMVFSLINPARERDVSHYQYFKKYAEYLDRLIEPVPVNRESLPVLKRVLPGGIAAFILQYYEPLWLKQKGNRLWKISNIADAIKANLIEDDFLIRNLKKGFSIDDEAPRFSQHRNHIEQYVEDVLTDFQISGGSGGGLMKALEPPIPRSLRDLEPTINIYGER